RIGAEIAGGYRLRPWISRGEKREIERKVEETLKLAALDLKAHLSNQGARIPRRCAQGPNTRATSLSKQQVRQREPHDGFRSRVPAVGRDAHRCHHLVA